MLGTIGFFCGHIAAIFCLYISIFANTRFFPAWLKNTPYTQMFALAKKENIIVLIIKIFFFVLLILSLLIGTIFLFFQAA